MEEFYSLDLTKSKYNLTIKEEVNPKTGANALWIFTFCGFSMIGIAATTCYWKKEDE